ncbi:unnamed protein product [Sphagnum troendelagicum]
MNPRRSSRSKSCSPQVRCRNGSNFNIQWQFSIFGGYRNTFGQILIHVFFVWPTILGVMTLLAYTKKFAASPPIFAKVPHNLGHYMRLNGSFIMAVVYSLFYIEMNLVVGTLAMFLLVACWIASNYMAQIMPIEQAGKVATATQVVCYTVQFVSRRVRRERSHQNCSPSFVDSILQAYVMAPFFVLLEVSHMLGYTGFQTEVHDERQVGQSSRKQLNDTKPCNQKDE